MRLLKTLLTIQLFYDTGKHTANDTVKRGCTGTDTYSLIPHIVLQYG